MSVTKSSPLNQWIAGDGFPEVAHVNLAIRRSFTRSGFRAKLILAGLLKSILPYFIFSIFSGPALHRKRWGDDGRMNSHFQRGVCQPHVWRMCEATSVLCACKPTAGRLAQNLQVATKICKSVIKNFAGWFDYVTAAGTIYLTINMYKSESSQSHNESRAQPADFLNPCTKHRGLKNETIQTMLQLKIIMWRFCVFIQLYQNFF